MVASCGKNPLIHSVTRSIDGSQPFVVILLTSAHNIRGDFAQPL